MPSQCSAPSWPLERRLHSLSRWTGNHSLSYFFLKFYFPRKSLFLPVSSLAAVALFLSSSIADHCVVGKLTERETGRQTDRKHAIPLRALLRKSASQAQSAFSLLSMSPMLRLHLDSMPACNDAASETEEPQTNVLTTPKTQERRRERHRARHLHIN